jgi:hypothetical protein
VAWTSLHEQLREVEAKPGDLRGLGSFGEAVAEIFVHEVMGHEIVVDEATRDKPQGVDLVTFDPATGQIVVVEVKTTSSRRGAGPRMRRTTSTRQMSDVWIAEPEAAPGGISRVVDAGLENVDLADVAEGFIRKLVVHVHVANDTVTAHEVDGDGQVGRTPTSKVSLRELIAPFDAATRAADVRPE